MRHRRRWRRSPCLYTWTGFYVGAGWGYGVSDTNSSVVPAAGAVQGTTNNGARGWLGMADAGYDYQFAVGGWNLVAGVLRRLQFRQHDRHVELHRRRPAQVSRR